MLAAAILDYEMHAETGLCVHISHQFPAREGTIVDDS